MKVQPQRISFKPYDDVEIWIHYQRVFGVDGSKNEGILMTFMLGQDKLLCQDVMRGDRWRFRTLVFFVIVKKKHQRIFGQNGKWESNQSKVDQN